MACQKRQWWENNRGFSIWLITAIYDGAITMNIEYLEVGSRFFIFGGNYIYKGGSWQ